MSCQWFFRPKHRGDDISDPISGEFFADGSLDNPATALVREALQNALDAGDGIDRGGQPVRVRIGHFRDAHAVPAAAASRWFGSLREHLEADGNGLKDVPAPGDACEYLLVEDFGTAGLTGDINSDSADGQQNNFVDFLRSDGRTRKGEGDRGSWGVGKNVFPRSSRINGYLAYTVRHDDGRRLLMGKSILKIRRVGAEEYQPACYLGATWDAGDVPRPHEDDDAIDRLREEFRVTRTTEAGLSLIVPWVDQEITFDDVLKAVVTQFYFAILSGALSVTLTGGDDEITLRPGDVVERVRTLMPDQAPMVELAAWSLTVTDADRLTLAYPPPDRPQQWSPELAADDVRVAINEKLLQRQRVAVRIPLHVRGVHALGPQPTYFDIYLEHEETARQQLRPGFFREQLCISGVKRATGAPKVRSLVVIDDKPLADLLRAAEPPNHTDWDPKTANFRKEYRDGSQVITFVKSAVTKLMSIVRSGDERPDATVAIDFFALPDPEEKTSPSPRKKKTKKPGEKPDLPFDPPPPKKRRFTIRPVEGGFVLAPGEADTTPPKRLKVQMAYDVMNGSPWKQYEEADFDLTRKDRSGVRFAVTGDADYAIAGTNQMEVKLSGASFEVHVWGFDTNRDLIVRAYDPKEPVDADSETELHEEAEAVAE